MMAGGIDWFRWHHGSVNDQKFGLIAKRAGASVAEVIATWACLLEMASASEDRGNPGNPDFESIDYALGMEDGKAEAIFRRMHDRGLIDGDSGRIASWEKRQPKRERTDDSSSERVRAFRERERHVTPKTTDETPCNAMERTETPRVEESREEERKEKQHSSGLPDMPAGFLRFWSTWPKSDRKVAKAECSKRWRSRGLEAQADEIVAHVEAMRESRQWRDGYDPAPLTYLNQRRWEDGAADVPKPSWLVEGYGDEAAARRDGWKPERVAA